MDCDWTKLFQCSSKIAQLNSSRNVWVSTEIVPVLIVSVILGSFSQPTAKCTHTHTFRTLCALCALWLLLLPMPLPHYRITTSEWDAQCVAEPRDRDRHRHTLYTWDTVFTNIVFLSLCVLFSLFAERVACGLSWCGEEGGWDGKAVVVHLSRFTLFSCSFFSVSLNRISQLYSLIAAFHIIHIDSRPFKTDFFFFLLSFPFPLPPFRFSPRRTGMWCCSTAWSARRRTRRSTLSP